MRNRGPETEALLPKQEAHHSQTVSLWGYSWLCSNPCSWAANIFTVRKPSWMLSELNISCSRIWGSLRSGNSTVDSLIVLKKCFHKAKNFKTLCCNFIFFLGSISIFLLSQNRTDAPVRLRYMTSFARMSLSYIACNTYVWMCLQKC